MTVRNTIDFDKVGRQFRAAIGVYGDTAARQLEGNAKKGAIWTDRTSNARNSIQGNFVWEGDNAVIRLSGNVDYFKYLELAMAKKYAILVPTVHQQSGTILKGYQKLVE